MFATVRSMGSDMEHASEGDTDRGRIRTVIDAGPRIMVGYSSRDTT